jgi:hypothetical protein
MEVIPKEHRFCWSCEKMYFSSGIQRWSEVTPGEDADMGCCDGLWTFELFTETLDSFREKISMAQDCEHFEKRK